VYVTKSPTVYVINPMRDLEFLQALRWCQNKDRSDPKMLAN